MTAQYNFAYLDEQTKRMVRRALLKAVAIPGYQVPFGSREMPLARGWGTGGIQITAAIIGPGDVLKVIDQGSDDTTNAVSIRRFFARVADVDPYKLYRAGNIPKGRDSVLQRFPRNKIFMVIPIFDVGTFRNRII